MRLLFLLACGFPPEVQRAPTAPCVGCHPTEVARWTGSHHALAERKVGPEDTWANAIGAVRIIGVEPLEQGIVPGEGREQIYDPAHDTHKGDLFSIFADRREPGDWGHWTGAGMTWNARCASCHNTGVKKNLQPDGSYQTTVTERGITCAACHGEAGGHAAGGPAPVNERMEDTCLACHTRRAELVDGFLPGANFFDHYVPLSVADPSFRADGRGLAEVFEGNQFLASGMHAAGVRCVDCHDPHSGDLLASGDALCVRCHGAPPGPEHPSHPAGVECVDCHMPPITVMARHARRDHGFTSPAVGLQPDPCAACHEAHPASTPIDPQVLAFERVRAGGPLGDLDLEPAPRGRHAAVLELLSGRPDGLPTLRARLTHADPWIRTAAVNALVPADRSDLERLERAALDPIRAVRVGAQRTLLQGGKPLAELPDAQTWFAHNADEPGALSERGIARVREGEEGGLADLRRAHQLDPSAGRWVVLLATGLSSRGRATEAEAVLEQHLRAHPDAVEVRFAHALVLVSLLRSMAAIGELERVLKQDPAHPRAWRNLALLHHKEGEPEATLEALESAIRLQPDDRELTRWRARLRNDLR